MDVKAGKERRESSRFDGNIPLKICEEHGDIVTETQNVSRSGAYCQVNRYLEPMTKMKICLMLPMRNNGRNSSKKVSCEGVVIRTEEIPESNQYNVAIFFNNISQKNINTLSDYVAQNLGKMS
ncbi:hypothetical protein MNBD_UNCLBAC01-1950 [hydrothermal vent metagenome]|uniref:PilZ domain-containing protein n=1 Tax=hydrothermal vent metagenome TaxID=652676 RepID=A0A3B1DLA6_9ZZZZ